MESFIYKLMDHLLAICSELGSVSDGCSALVMVNLDDIYEFLTNQLDPDDVCNLFGEFTTRGCDFGLLDYILLAMPILLSDRLYSGLMVCGTRVPNLLP